MGLVYCMYGCFLDTILHCTTRTISKPSIQFQIRPFLLRQRTLRFVLFGRNITIFTSAWVSACTVQYSTVQHLTWLDLLEQLWLHTVHTVHGTSLALNVGDLWSVAAAAAAASARLESSRQHQHIQWRIVLHHWMQCSYTYCSLWMDVYNEITAITWCTCSWFDGLRCGRKLPIVLLLMSYDTIHSYQCHRYRFIARTRCSSYISGE